MRPLRVLFFLHPGTNSRHIFLALMHGFEAAGHHVTSLDLGQLWAPRNRLTEASQRHALTSQFANALRQHFRQHQVDLTIGMWANGLVDLPVTPDPLRPGKLRPFADAVGVPHLCYWLDAPQWAADGSLLTHVGTGVFSGPRVFHIVNNQGLAAEMQSLFDMPRTLAVPYGISTRQFSPPSPRTTPVHDLVFQLGPGELPPTPAMLAALASDDPDLESLRREQAAHLQPALAREIGPLAAPLVQSQLTNRAAPVHARLHALLAADASLRPAADALRAAPVTYARVTGTLRRIDGWYRAFVFAWLDRRFDCLRVGGADMSDWPTRGPVEPFALEPAAQAAHYARGRAGLSVMRWQDDLGLHIKPFEISASGVPCLVHRRPGLDDLFTDGTDALAFDTLPQAADHLRRLRDDPALRERLAAAALARTLRDHTWTARLPRLLEWMNQSCRWW